MDNHRDGSSKVRFAVNASLESVNAFFHCEGNSGRYQLGIDFDNDDDDRLEGLTRF